MCQVASLEFFDTLWGLGLTWSLPTEDKVNGYKKQILDQISMAMGGRIAEELIFHG